MQNHIIFYYLPVCSEQGREEALSYINMKDDHYLGNYKSDTVRVTTTYCDNNLL